MKKKLSDIELIKEIFKSLDPEHKVIAKQKISNKFNVAEDSVNNRWIYKMEIPESNISGVLTIIKNVGQKQTRKIQKLIA